MEKLEKMIAKYGIVVNDGPTWVLVDYNRRFFCVSYDNLVKFRNAYCKYFGLNSQLYRVVEA